MTYRITHYGHNLPVPPALAAVPQEQHPEHGTVIRSVDVARAFGVKHSTLRQWRRSGAFPDTLDRVGRLSYYKLDSELIGHYYDRHPGALADPEDAQDALLFSVRNPVIETHAVLHGVAVASAETEAAAPILEAEPRHLSALVRDTEITQSVRAELVAAVSEAIAQLVERSPEPPAVIEALAVELAAQRKTIQQQQSEIEQKQREIEQAQQEIEDLRAVRQQGWWARIFGG